MYTVSTGGCYAHHPAPYKMYRPNGISEYLLLFVRTKANFQIGENTFEVLPNQIVIIDKNLHSAAFQLAAQIVMKVFQSSTLCCKIVCKKLHYKAR